jgi:hypothetical protein
MSSIGRWNPGEVEKGGTKRNEHEEDVLMDEPNEGDRKLPENVLRIASLIVDLGKERVKVAGAAAAIIVQVLLHANELNAMAVGSAQLDWSNGKGCLRISKSFEPVWFEL